MELRDKFNKVVINNFGEYIHELAIKNEPFTPLRINGNVILKGIYDLKYIFDYEHEEKCILTGILDGIKDNDANKIIDICDSYKYKFIDLYDYILEQMDLNKFNYDKLYKLFCDVLINTSTTNGINLSVFMLYTLGSLNICKISNALLIEDIEYIEVFSYISNGAYEGNNIFFNIFSYRYGNKSLTELIDKYLLSNHEFKKIDIYICVFYIFRIHDFIGYIDENIRISLLEFLYNLKVMAERCVDKQVYKLKFSISKLNKDIYMCIEKNQLNFNLLEDLSSTYRYIKILPDKHKGFVRDEIIKNIDEVLSKYINDREDRNLRYIIEVLNDIDLDISCYLDKFIVSNYQNIEFHIFLIFNMRKYIYLNNVLKRIEDISYLSYLIRNDRFAVVLLRIMVVLYKYNQTSKSGIRFLKVLMEHEELYYRYRSYVNYLLLHIMLVGV